MNQKKRQPECKPYGFIYETILPDGRFYRGQHKIISHKTLDPSYFGSGVIIRDWVKSHGKSELSRKILCFGYSVDEMNSLEAKFITEELLNDPLCINLDKGGRHKYSRFPEVNQRISVSMVKVRKDNPNWKSVTGANNNKSKRWKLIDPAGNEYHIHGTLSAFCREHKISEATIKKAIYEGWRPARGICAGWQAFDLDTGRGTHRDTQNRGEFRQGINNPSHKAKLKRRNEEPQE